MSFSGRECNAFLLLSTGRTGTQTLAALLRLSPHVVAQHEPAPRLVQASYDAYMDKGAPDWLERWSAFALATRDDFVLGANAEGKVYVESNNRLTYLASAVKTAFPASKVYFFAIATLTKLYGLGCSVARIKDQEKHGILPASNLVKGSHFLIHGQACLL